jgi:hypothetical protein
MAQKKKKTGTQKVAKQRYNPSTGSYDTYYVTEDVFTYVSDTSNYGSSDSGSSSSYDSGSSGGSYGE